MVTVTLSALALMAGQQGPNLLGSVATGLFVLSLAIIWESWKAFRKETAHG